VTVLAIPALTDIDDTHFSLPVTTEGIAVGQEMMFLGFPAIYNPLLGFSLHNGFPLPLAKYARLSTFPIENQPMWLDGHNNKGFSGGPLCFAPNGSNELKVAGVVTAYKPSLAEVVDEEGSESGQYALENSGFMLAWDVRYCRDIIKANPIGTPFET